MSEGASRKIKVIKPEDITWEEAMRYPEETDPAGQEFTAARSVDDKFSFGLWQRDVQRRHFERGYHEIAYIIEGQVEVTDDDGEVIVAGPGDILITPKGSKGYWKNLSPVKKVWAIYEEAGADIDPYIGPGKF
ncbi:MAG TPA: cupin domain-containing protein [Thermoleophilia bacterium]|nr:cupin domain-containing protein [Thermoleophilia bacterium]HQG04463.1 cupin domain-containing protein [Thermoleophilia bacterium]HQG55180.1 cupin domain-containing protein [Thermoleophilia bacterium]HQJ98620.1 cupin domain-containing protein [Thermoleophilia bacterium]